MKRSTLSRSRRCSSLRLRSMLLLCDGGFLDGRMQAGRIDYHAEFLQIMRMAELVQRERLVDRRGLAHDIDRAVDGLLCQLQREGRLCRDPLRQCHHEG